MSDIFDDYGIEKPKNSASVLSSSASDDLFANYPSVSVPDKNLSLPISQTIAQPESNPQNQTPSVLLTSRENESNLDDLFGELNGLIGLQNVKEEVRRLIQFVRVQEMRRQKGLGISSITLHSVFYGSPGTGKTTVARIYGKMLKALGLLHSGHLVETDRAGLVANYIGQTATKTEEKVNEALGGVLFIDEAYSLYKGNDAHWDYGNEAIDILLKRMEDYRDNFVIIVAGYPLPMKEFLKSNEGFKSRFSTFISFEDYIPDDLIQIFNKMCQDENYLVPPITLESVKALTTFEYGQRDASFGNARYVRNLFQTILRNQALRIGETISHPTEVDLLTIQPEDVPKPNISNQEIPPKLGFQ